MNLNSRILPHEKGHVKINKFENKRMERKRFNYVDIYNDSILYKQTNRGKTVESEIWIGITQNFTKKIMSTKLAAIETNVCNWKQHQIKQFINSIKINQYKSASQFIANSLHKKVENGKHCTKKIGQNILRFETLQRSTSRYVCLYKTLLFCFEFLHRRIDDRRSKKYSNAV